MLAIQAQCLKGHIHLPQEGLPLDAKVVVVFLDADSDYATASSSLSLEQQAALQLQSQSNFAQNILLNPAEDCWNKV